MTRALRFLRRSVREHLDVWLVFLIGAFLRIHYALRTPYPARAYDWHGHQYYVDFVMNNHALPSASTTWEGHQSPLYYVIAAAWARVTTGLGRADQIWDDLQYLSLLISLLSLAAAAWVCFVAFPRKNQEPHRMITLGMMATLPGMVFMSSRITNDGLALLGLTMFTGFLLRWWKKGTTRDWIWAAVIAAVCVLIKLSAGIFCIAALCLCLPLRPGMRLRRMAGLLGALAGILVVIAGWYAAWRLHDNFYQRMFLTQEPLGLNLKLMMPHRVADFFVFSPTRVIGLAFNDPWSDLYGRRWFWEYLFKSAFTGEWRLLDFTMLTRTMLAGGMIALLLAAAGAMRGVGKRAEPALPLVVIAVSAVLFLALFRWLHNAGCNQDFRFVPHLGIPLALLACMGVDAVPKRFGFAARTVLVGLCCACAAFVVSLAGW